jgi:16S rRNA (cytosine967-C5)-methyltransferase
MHDLVEPPIILAGVSERSEHEHLRRHAHAGFAIFTGSHAELLALLESDASIRVQDPASARPVAATRGLKPGVIADLCAGRGTKTRQLAATHPAARIIASDIDADRVNSLRARFQGSEQVTIIERREWLAHANSVDLLVLDVPCSNTGVLARRVEAKYRFDDKHVAELVSLQRQILADSLALRAPGGRILYATCSIDRRENQDQAAWLGQWHQLAIEREELTMPSGVPGEPALGYHDGGYWALAR